MLQQRHVLAKALSQDEEMKYSDYRCDEIYIQQLTKLV